MTKSTQTKTAENQPAKVSSAFVFEGRIVKAGDKITLKQSDFKLLQQRGKIVAIKATTTKKPVAADAEPDDSKSGSKTPNESDES